MQIHMKFFTNLPILLTKFKQQIQSRQNSHNISLNFMVF